MMDNNTQNDPRAKEIMEGMLVGDQIASERQSAHDQFMVELMGAITNLVSEVGSMKQEINQLKGGAEASEPTTVAPVNPNTEQKSGDGFLESLMEKVGMNNATNE